MILALDTSGSRCGVAIWEFGQVRFTETESALRHNEELLQHIFRMTLSIGEKPCDLRAIAISSGPGSFTGLRVGMAVAKGLCWCWRLPLIGVPTLEAYANTTPANSRRVVPLMPARAEEVYWSLYEWEEPDGWSMKMPCRVSHIAELPEMVSGPIALCGEGLERHRRRLLEFFGGRVIAAPKLKDQISVMSSLAQLAAQRFESGRFEDLFQAEPAYHYPFLRSEVSGPALGG